MDHPPLACPEDPHLPSLRRALAILALVAALGYLVWANARWKEQATVALDRAAVTTKQLDSLTVRWAAAADSAHRFRLRADTATQVAAYRSQQLARLRFRYDSAVANPVTLADTVILTQDSVIAAKDSVIGFLRQENDHLRFTGSVLLQQRALLLDERDSLLGLVRRAPVVQVASPRPKTGWVAAGAFVVGFLTGVL